MPGESEATSTENSTTETAAAEAAPVEITALGSAGEAVEEANAAPAGAEAAKVDDAPAAPVVPEAYELAAPEGLTLDAKAVELATPVFKDLGLSNEAANKLMPVAGEFAKQLQQGFQASLEQQEAAARAGWLDSAKKDAEIGGAKWDETMAMGAKALDHFGAKPFREFLNQSGLGNHPEMIRLFAKIGRTIGEDTFARGDPAAKVAKTDAELFYPNMARAA